MHLDDGGSAKGLRSFGVAGRRGSVCPSLRAGGRGVVDDHAIEPRVEPVGSMRCAPLYLAAEPLRGWPNAGVPDAGVVDVPVEGGRELGDVFSVDHLDPDRELLEHGVDELLLVSPSSVTGASL